MGKLHEQAMTLAREATDARGNGRYGEAARLYSQAMIAELDGIAMLESYEQRKQSIEEYALPFMEMAAEAAKLAWGRRVYVPQL